MAIRKKPALMAPEAVGDIGFPRHCMHCLPRPNCS